MTGFLLTFLKRLRLPLIAALAFMVVGVTSADVRQSVMLKLQENGVQRFYETEVHQSSASDLRVSQLRIGRKPNEARRAYDLSPPWPAAISSARAPHGPASPRAPPHQPRAPPFA